MARKFGKKNEISLDIADYNHGIFGLSGVGKTTVVKNICENLVGEDGYVFLNCGKEDGVSAITGIIYEDVPDWDTFEEVIEDIVENKSTDYKDLRIVVIDTIDQLFEIAEPEVIRLHNKEKPDKRVTSINEAFSGFGKGLDKAIEIVLDKLWELKSVGVSFFIIGHIKNKTVDDIITSEEYDVVTANLSQRYFNAIKTKLHTLGMAIIDRNIVKEKTGKKNMVTKKDETKGVIKSEARRIRFRDDNFSVDSKSRFAEIVDEVPLDAEEYIKALKDAILAEHSKGDKTLEQTQKEQSKQKKEKEKQVAEKSKQQKEKKEVDNIIEQISNYIKENKSDLSKVKPLIEFAKEKGFKNPLEVTDLEIAKDLLNMIG